jgi:DNA-binding CsgD family transcriptional regulator
LEEIQSLSGGKPVFLLELERRRGRRIPQLHDGPGRLAQLSPKERELITLLCQGRRNAEIAKQLHLSVGTVKRELNLIYQKLRVQSRNQLIARLRWKPGGQRFRRTASKASRENGIQIAARALSR